MPPRRPNAASRRHVEAAAAHPVYPFTSIVRQDEMKLALLLNAVAPTVGGVLIMGERGTGKSTAVRALAELLPPLSSVRGCVYHCDPADERNLCDECRARFESGGRLVRERASVPVVELPLGATEDRVCGTIDIERALVEGRKAFEPGLLARANRGFLYIDEVNLLEDHLVDLLLDAASTGRNKVEREGISTVHPSRFVLVGSGNPEEGELRPQLLDRFGLYTEVRGVASTDERVEIVERREAFEHNPSEFLARVEGEQGRLRRRLVRARALFASVEMPRPLVRLIAELCVRLKVDGHRGELTLARAARALAAFEGRRTATETDVRRVAAMSLRHRLRRDPLEQTSGGSRIGQALEELSGSSDAGGGAQASKQTAAKESSARGSEVATGKITGKGDGENGQVENAEARTSSSAWDSSPANDRRDAQGREQPGARGEELNAPPVDASLPEGALEGNKRLEKPRATASKASKPVRGGSGAQARIEASGGRYARAVSMRTRAARVAFDATLRAAAPLQVSRRRQSNSPRLLLLASDDLRFKQLRRKTGTLFILAVDTSGSMAANRIGQAKGALAHLLRRSYIRRDRDALITFREREARLQLPPSQSPARAKRILDALPVGGATPLSAALLCALEVAERAARTGAPQRIVLLVFTDGRANVALHPDTSEERAASRRRIRRELEELGAALQREGVASVVVDTQNRYVTGGEAKLVADALGGRHLHLPPLDAGEAIASALVAS